MASKITVNNFDRYRRALRAEQDRRVARAAIVVQRHAKQLLSVAGTGVWDERSRRIQIWKDLAAGGGISGIPLKARFVSGGKQQVFYGKYRRHSKGSRKYGANPSAPGEPPHKQTGRLRASVTWEKVREGVARVGTNVKYGRLLELFIGPRPWLRRALAEESREVDAILGAPWRWSGR